MRQTAFHYKELEEYWPKFKDIVTIIRNKTQYNKMVKNLDRLIDEIGSDQNHPLASLMEVIGILIEDYERERVYLPKGDPIDILKDLMNEHQLKQVDIKEIGSQGVVSEVLNRKRTLNVRQAQALAKRFNVSLAVFIE